ncbi:MAG: RagB/SusD family nutrient uptake outer membrane protein [Longimicrobiales bacterium]
MTKWTRYGALPALVVAGMSVTGCSETALVGSVLDEDISTGDSTIQLALARGSNSELTDILTIGAGYKWVVLAGTDDILNDDDGSPDRWATGDWDRDDIETIWEQGMEAVWSGLKLVNNAMTGFSTAAFQTTPIVARGYLNSAHGERLLGDLFCQVAYGFDNTGGQDLDNLGSSTFDGAPVAKDSAYKRMATFAELALAQAERAVAAGVPNPATAGVLSDGHFDPARLVTASHGAAAQAYHALAALGVDSDTNWDLAIQHAAQVPTDFVEVTIHDEDVEDNEFWDRSWDNDEFTLYSEADASRPEGFFGVPATFLWLSDARVMVQDCINNRTGPEGFRCSRTRSESERFPMWVPLKYPEEGTDDEMVTGTEMRLIEAEEALVRSTNFTAFYDKIDEVRAFYGAGVTARPAVVGNLEWPNAEDDAMSILDRERYLTMWMEGRRLFDLHRWNHPFITNNEGLIQRHDDILAGVTRKACAPIAESECRLNPNVPCT